MSRLGRAADGPRRAELLELYKSSVDEYRFQVQLNWSRSQYLLAFNVAIVAAGAGLVKVGGTFGSVLTAGVFAVGIVTAVLSIAVTAVQHGYYRTARDRMRRFEERLNIKRELRVDTTPAMRSRVKRLGRITTMLYLIFAFTALLDFIGVYVSAAGPKRGSIPVPDAPASSPAVVPTSPVPSSIRQSIR
jgi:hypothetical protein